MSNTPNSAVNPAGQEVNIWAYRYVNKAYRGTGETLMFVKHFGQGAESAAQLVKNAHTGEVLVRKVVMALYRRAPDLLNTPFHPKPPREIEILDRIHSWPEVRGITHYLSQCYSHEYQKAKVSSEAQAGTLYRHVGLWKMCNGGAVIRNDELNAAGTLGIRMTDSIPMAAIGRCIWQVMSSFHFLGHGNPEGIPVQHRDAHPGNIFMHWNTGPVDLDNPSALLPDFILGDFGEAEFLPNDSIECYRQPLTTDIERINYILRICLEEVGVYLMTKRPGNSPLWERCQGPHRASYLKLLDVSLAIDDLAKLYKDKREPMPYPDLRPIIEMGKEIETMCLKGGIDASLMEGDAWKRFVGERRSKALAMSTLPVYTVRGTKKQALNPVLSGTQGRLELFGPWTLCVAAWKVDQAGPEPVTDPNWVKYPHTRVHYRSRDIFDALPIVQEDDSYPVQHDNGKVRMFDHFFTQNAKVQTKVAQVGEAFTVALNFDGPNYQEYEQHLNESSPTQKTRTMPAAYPLSDPISDPVSDPVSSDSEPTSEDSFKPPSLGEFREEELELLYDEMIAMESSADEQQDSSADEAQFDLAAQVFNPGAQAFDPVPQAFDPGAQAFDPGAQAFDPGAQAFNPGAQAFNPGAQAFNPGVQAFVPGAQAFDPTAQAFDPTMQAFIPPVPIVTENEQPQLPPSQPFGYTDGVDDYPEVTANLQYNNVLNDLKQKQAIMARLHWAVHGGYCTCDQWHIDIEDRLEMITVSSDEELSSRESSVQGSLRSNKASPSDKKSPETENTGTDKESPETDNTGTSSKEPESSPATDEDNSPLERESKTSFPSPKLTPAARRPQPTRSSRLPVPVPASQRAAAAATPSRPPTSAATPSRPPASAAPSSSAQTTPRPTRPPVQRPPTRPTTGNTPATTRKPAPVTARTRAPTTGSVARQATAISNRPPPTPTPAARSSTVARRPAHQAAAINDRPPPTPTPAARSSAVARRPAATGAAPSPRTPEAAAAARPRAATTQPTGDRAAPRTPATATRPGSSSVVRQTTIRRNPDADKKEKEKVKKPTWK